jgi:hypothetical protein
MTAAALGAQAVRPPFVTDRTGPFHRGVIEGASTMLRTV